MQSTLIGPEVLAERIQELMFIRESKKSQHTEDESEKSQESQDDEGKDSPARIIPSY